eukprot:COSAG02_NODE_1837_length_10712_cov_4.781306_7_plen_73_part_00
MAQSFPLPCHQIVTHVRSAKGDCFGGVVGAKTKSSNIEGPISPKTAGKRPLAEPELASATASAMPSGTLVAS